MSHIYPRDENVIKLHNVNALFDKGGKMAAGYNGE